MLTAKHCFSYYNIEYNRKTQQYAYLSSFIQTVLLVPDWTGSATKPCLCENLQVFCRSQTRRNCFRFTASREFHPTPKNFFLYSGDYFNTNVRKKQPFLFIHNKDTDSAKSIQYNHFKFSLT